MPIEDIKRQPATFSEPEEELSPADMPGPEPTEEQGWLWQNIEDGISETALLRAQEFLDLPPEERDILSSLETATRIGKLQKEHALTDERTAELAALVKYVFLRKIPKIKFRWAIVTILEVSDDKAAQIEQSLADLIDRAGSWKPLKRAAIAPELDALPRRELPKTGISQAPQEASAEDAQAPEASTEEPFMLHEEQTGASASETPAENVRPSFSFAPPRKPQPNIAPPVTARIENQSGQAKARIVHYSKFRTPLEDEQGSGNRG